MGRARPAVGVSLIVVAVLFTLGCFFQMCASAGRPEGQEAFYWNWVLTFTGIGSAVVGALALGFALLGGK